MTESVGGERRGSAVRRKRRVSSPARGILIGLLLAVPCWIAIGYGIYLLLSRL